MSKEECGSVVMLRECCNGENGWGRRGLNLFCLQSHDNVYMITIKIEFNRSKSFSSQLANSANTAPTIFYINAYQNLSIQQSRSKKSNLFHNINPTHFSSLSILHYYASISNLHYRTNITLKNQFLSYLNITSARCFARRAGY